MIKPLDDILAMGAAASGDKVFALTPTNPSRDQARPAFAMGNIAVMRRLVCSVLMLSQC